MFFLQSIKSSNLITAVFDHFVVLFFLCFCRDYQSELYIAGVNVSCYLSEAYVRPDTQKNTHTKNCTS